MHVTISDLPGLVARRRIVDVRRSPRSRPPRRRRALHAQAVEPPDHRNAMVIYGSAKPPYGPVDIVVEDGLIAYIGATAGRRVGRRADAVIDATGKYVMPGIVNTHMHWHEERQPGIAAADSVRAQSLPGRRRHDRARGRRRLRQVEAVAGREQRAHDHLAAHPGLPGRQQGADRARRPRFAPGSATSKQRGADGLKIIGDGSRSARGDHGRGAHAGPAHGRRTSASKRRRRRTTSSSASTRSSTSTASPTRRSTASRTSRPT